MALLLGGDQLLDFQYGALSMIWTNLFRSRYVLFLEDELARVRKRHAEELETLKTSHAKELERCITEANRGWAEADRLRQFLVPGLPASTRATDIPDSTPPKTEKVEEEQGQTPFQRLAYKSYKMQEAAAKEAERITKLATQFPTKETEEKPNAKSN
jgi:hypothetical protein